MIVIFGLFRPPHLISEGSGSRLVLPTPPTHFSLFPPMSTPAIPAPTDLSPPKIREPLPLVPPRAPPCRPWHNGFISLAGFQNHPPVALYHTWASKPSISAILSCKAPILQLAVSSRPNNRDRTPKTPSSYTAITTSYKAHHLVPDNPPHPPVNYPFPSVTPQSCDLVQMQKAPQS
jgi:hypothetical protein